MENEELLRKLEDLTRDLEDTKRILASHTHSGNDGSDIIFNNPISVKPDGLYRIGSTVLIGVRSGNFDVGQISSGDMLDGIQTTGYNFNESAFGLVHDRSSGVTTSRVLGSGGPQHIGIDGATITSGSTIVSISNMEFEVNELAGLYIVVINSPNSHIVKVISNTATTVTMDRACPFSVTNGQFAIFNPLYLGWTTQPFKRLYLIDSSDGGIRFGPGATNGGENSLLYANSSGSLIFRDKEGVETTVVTGT